MTDTRSPSAAPFFTSTHSARPLSRITKVRPGGGHDAGPGHPHDSGLTADRPLHAGVHSGSERAIATRKIEFYRHGASFFVERVRDARDLPGVGARGMGGDAELDAGSAYDVANVLLGNGNGHAPSGNLLNVKEGRIGPRAYQPAGMHQAVGDRPIERRLIFKIGQHGFDGVYRALRGPTSALPRLHQRPRRLVRCRFRLRHRAFWPPPVSSRGCFEQRPVFARSVSVAWNLASAPAICASISGAVRKWDPRRRDAGYGDASIGSTDRDLPPDPDSPTS